MHIFYLSWWIDDATSAAQSQDFQDRFGEKMALASGWVGDWNKFDYNVLSQQLKKLKQLSAPVNAAPVYIMPDLNEPEDLVTYYTKHSERFGFDQCVSIYQNPEIDSNGNMSPCRDYHDYVVGNMKDTSILDLWNNEKYVKFRSSISNDGLMPVCSRCCGLMGY
jgi:radical SAM protein with 4Fe4S-binding SPASM domain